MLINDCESTVVFIMIIVIYLLNPNPTVYTLHHRRNCRSFYGSPREAGKKYVRKKCALRREKRRREKRRSKRGWVGAKKKRRG